MCSKQVIFGDTLYESSGVGYGQPIIINQEPHRTHSRIIAMAESVNHCLTECPSIEVWQIDTNQAAHDFVAGIPRLHQLAYTIKHIHQGQHERIHIDLWRHAFHHLKNSRCGWNRSMNSINRTNGEQTSNRWLQSIRAINNQLKCPIEILISKRQQRVLRIGTANMASQLVP